MNTTAPPYAGAGSKDVRDWLRMRDYAFEVTGSNSVAELIARTLETALVTLRAASASLSRLEPEQGRVKILHNLGDLAPWEEPHPDARYYVLDEYAQLLTTLSGHARCWAGSVNDPQTSAADRDLLRRLEKRHAASFQILVADQVWGDLYVTRADGPAFDEEDVAAGLVLVGLLSAGLSRLELLAELSSLAYTDPLTQLANRRAADEWLELRLSMPQPFPLVSVVLCDIDGLKRVNDTFGHSTGDDLVRLAASEVAAAAGPLHNVLAARIGGDEFVLLVDGAESAQVEAAVRRLADLSLPFGSTLSVGAASLSRRPHGADSPKAASRALLRLADAAQYRHKRTRRLATAAVPADVTSIATVVPPGATKIADQVIAALKTEPDRSPERRLQIVCDAVALGYDAHSWWVSREVGGVLVDVLGRVLRPDPRDGLNQLDMHSGSEFDPRDYPATSAALRGGSFFASYTEGDPAQRALLAGSGFVSCLAAGEPGKDGRRWLAELYGDHRTSSGLFVMEGCLRSLIHIAVHGADA